MTATPEQRRDAWLGLVSALEAKLVMTRENAKAQRRLCEDVGEVSVLAMVPEWDATAWAAGRLLESLKDLAPPVVPRDDETGQGDLVQLLADAIWPESTPGEKPGDDCPHANVRMFRDGGPGYMKCLDCGARVVDGDLD